MPQGSTSVLEYPTSKKIKKFVHRKKNIELWTDQAGSLEVGQIKAVGVLAAR